MTLFVLECQPGENGGLRPLFHLEVYNIGKVFPPEIFLNLTSKSPPQRYFREGTSSSQCDHAGCSRFHRREFAARHCLHTERVQLQRQGS